MADDFSTLGYREDIHVSEADKNKEDYLKSNIDHWISVAVREKTHISKLRNYYNGVRDDDDFLYLTENFGLGSPSKLRFTPLIKPRVDALLGKLLTEDVKYRVTCIDDKSIDVGMQERKMKYLSEIKSSVENFIQGVAQAVEKGQQPTPTSTLDATMKAVSKRYLSNYTSDLEIAAQDLLNYFQRSSTLGLKQKLKQLVLDLLITGECYYRVYYDRAGSDPILDIIKPENLFFSKNTNDQDLRNVDAVVHREYLTRKTVLKRYGKYMNQEQLDELFGTDATAQSMSRYQATDLTNNTTYNPYKSQITGYATDVLTVLHVEWIGLNKVDIDDPSLEESTDGYMTTIKGKTYRADRYEGTKIGDVYVNCGRVDNVCRSSNDPYSVKLTYNGVSYNDRSGKPYSLVSAMIDVQDLYDIVAFYRDAIIASSGTKGDRVNTAAIPTELGNDFMERLIKFIAIKKQGIELINPELPGASAFQHYGSFDNSLSNDNMSAIKNVLDSLELQADLICGVNAQMLGQIAQRDAVTNVQQGIQQSLLMNEDLFELVRSNQKEIMLDLLDVSKLTYKQGKRISYIVGNESFIFNIMPDMMTFSDFAIEPSYSSKDEMKLQNLQMLIKELASGQMIDPDVLIKASLSDSITEVKEMVDDAIAQKKQENDQLQQAQQQMQQMEQQLNELKNKNNQLQQKLDQIDAEEKKQQQLKTEADIKAQDKKLELEEKKADDLAEYQQNQIRLKEKLLQAELIEAKTGTGNEKEIKNV